MFVGIGCGKWGFVEGNNLLVGGGESEWKIDKKIKNHPQPINYFLQLIISSHN